MKRTILGTKNKDFQILFHFCDSVTIIVQFNWRTGWILAFVLEFSKLSLESELSHVKEHCST